MKNIILNKIKEYDVITIFGHIFPDGDCYGSQLGLKYFIEENFKDKKVYALGSGFKKMFPLIGYMDEVSDEVINSSLAIVLDCSTADRVEDKRFNNAKEVIHIDHHVKSNSFCNISYVDENAVSTTEILTNLFVFWNLKINKKSASSLMLGLITDGGRFLYSPSASEFNVASILIKSGADLESIYDILYESDISDLDIKKLVYSSYNIRNGVVYTYFDNDTIKKYNKTVNITSQTVNYLSSIKNYPVWASFAQDENGFIKCEFRCKKGYDVSKLAITHNGGGHICASGCTLSSFLEIEGVVKELEDLVVEQKYLSYLNEMIESIKKARTRILEVYNTPFDVEIKDDNSPVTKADKEADEIIRKHLSEKFPKVSFLTEESVDDKKRLLNDYVFIVDPVDGTKDFVSRNGEFTTNIALCENHEIVVGVVSIPVTGEIYYAVKNVGAYYLKDDNSKPIRIHVSDKLDDLKMYISRFHATEYEKELAKNSSKISIVEERGSSIKACFIAHGLGDLHCRLSAGTKEWDTAAIQIIVEEAGGIFVKPDGTRYKYNREDVYNREGYIIVNRKENIILKK